MTLKLALEVKSKTEKTEDFRYIFILCNNSDYSVHAQRIKDKASLIAYGPDEETTVLVNGIPV